ncbi:hypothetical protein AN219_23140, partial [Streptomyces nanshensis]
MPVGVPREDAVSARRRASVPQQSDGSHERSGGNVKSGLTLLVIEDSLAGGRSVPEMLDAASGYLPGDAHSGTSGERIKVRTARNLTEAERLLTDDVQCILLDLALTGAVSGVVTGAGSGGASGAVSGAASGVGGAPAGAEAAEAGASAASAGSGASAGAAA